MQTQTLDDDALRRRVSADREPVEGAHRRRPYRVIAPLVGLLLVWIWLLFALDAFKGGPKGTAYGGDFAMFFAAATMVKHGENPYDHTALYHAEASILRRQNLPMSPANYVRVGNPPLLYWALSPFTGFRFQPVALGWMACMFALSGLGFLASLRYFGWKHWLLPLMMFLMMPQVIMGAYHGNVNGLVFAAIAGSLALMRRSPILAGAILSLAWIKPQVTLAIVLLVILFHAGRPLEVMGGFSAGTLSFLALTVAATGWNSVVAWIKGVTTFSQAINLQSDFAPLAGLYTHWASAPVRLGLQVFLLTMALACTGVVWWQRRSAAGFSFLDAAWLWFVWFLATPFAHFHDEILLTIPVLALLGRDGSRLQSPGTVLTLYLMFLSVLLLSVQPAQVILLSLPLVVAGTLLWLARRQPVYVAV